MIYYSSRTLNDAEKKIPGCSIRVGKVSCILTRIENCSLHRLLRVKIPYDEEGRKCKAYSLDLSITRFDLEIRDKKV